MKLNAIPYLLVVTTIVTSQLAAQHGSFVIANRGSGDISVISARTDRVTSTHALPDNGEPMYVVAGRQGRRIFVGDRANDRVVVFRRQASGFAVETTIPAGKGVFHMWADFWARQLWVNNDVDNTASVIDMRRLKNVATVKMPADLVADGGKPHDVVLDPRGHAAFVSMVGLSGANDFVVKFSTRSGKEIGRAAVGQDPHVALTWRNNLLYVPTQNANEVRVLRRSNLSTAAILKVPGAHGAGMPRYGRYFYVTNIPGGGTDALWTIDTRTNKLVGKPVDTPFPTPHNVAVSPLGRKLCVTHSGATANTVTIYSTSWRNPVPTHVASVKVGSNPFGLAWVR